MYAYMYKVQCTKWLKPCIPVACTIEYIHYAPTVSMLIPTSLNRGQVGELTTGNGNSPTTGCQLSPDSYLGEFTLDVNSPTLEQYCDCTIEW